MILQHILAYLILAVAVGYLVKKFLLPRSLFTSKKGKSCGSDNCGCH